jgi:hypothetical protein
LVLSPTGLINLGFILREDLLLCSSYLPLGVPNWAVNYTPSPTTEKGGGEVTHIIELRLLRGFAIVPANHGCVWGRQAGSGDEMWK